MMAQEIRLPLKDGLVLFKLLKWIAGLILVIYFTPKLMAGLVLISLLIYFLLDRPEKDYFWVAIALILTDYPANLFYNFDRSLVDMGIINLNYIELFSLAAFFKVVLRPRYGVFPKILLKPYGIYLFWLSFLIVYGVAFVGISGGGSTGYRYIYFISRVITVFPLFYSLPIIINSNEKVVKFAQLVFILVIFNFVGQIFSVITHTSLHALLGGRTATESEVFAVGRDLVRPIFAPFTTLFAVLLAGYFLYSESRIFSKQKSLWIIIICFMSVAIAALRTWILAYGFLLFIITMLPILTNRRKSVFFRIIVILVPIIFALVSNRLLKKQFNAVMQRFSTLELILKGDLTAGGTNARFTDRPRIVMEKVYQSPIIGWGFSGTAIDTWDGHVGHQSILMEGGLIGFTIILYLWYVLIANFLRLSRHRLLERFKLSNMIAASVVIVSIIIHTGTQRYGFLLFVMAPTTAFTTSLFLALVARLYNFSYSQVAAKNAG